MRMNRNLILLGCLLAGAGLAPLAAQANPIVSMELTGVQGPSLGVAYTDPYYASVGPAGLTKDSQFTSRNSTTLAIYCDDFYDDVHTGQVWQATVTNLSQLSTSKVDTTLMFPGMSAATQAKDYMAAAWLAEQIAGLNQNLSSGRTAAELDSYAIWYLFDPNAISGLSSTDRSAIKTDYNDALAAVLQDTPSDFSNIDIYTPLNSSPGCAGSQEYLSILPNASVPEPSTLSLAALALLAAAFAARRRRQTI